MKAKATGYLIFAGHVYEPNPNPPPTWIPSDGAYVYVEKAPGLSDYTPCEQNNHGSYCNYDGVQGGFTSCVFARKTINGVYHEDWAFLYWNGSNPTYHDFYMTPGHKRCYGNDPGKHGP